MKEFFETLKQQRERKGLSLQDVHLRTRLPIHILQAIESGNVDQLPTGYDKLYIRKYAKVIGLNPDEVARDYELFTGKKSTHPPATAPVSSPASPPVPTAQPSARQTTQRMRELISEVNWDFWYRIFWGVGILGILILIGYFSYQQYSEVTQQQVEVKEISIPEMVQELHAETAAATTLPSASKPAESPIASTFQVILKGKARTWIREIRDGKDTTEYILPPGVNRTIEAREKIKFTIGRADGVQILLNGVPLKPLGDSTLVVTSLVITPNGVVQKFVRKPKRKTSAPPETSISPPSPPLRLRNARPDSLRTPLD